MWTEETKNTIDWAQVDGVGWFSRWFINGWFSGDAAWVEETKGTIDWTQI